MAARRRSTLSPLKVPLPKAAGTSCASCGWRSLLRCGAGINRSRLRDRIEPAPGCGVEARAFKLEPISKSPEEDKEASELYEAEEVVGVVFPTDEDAALPLNPSKEALHEPTSHIAA